MVHQVSDELFDDIPRTNSRPALFSESSFEFLNRSARPASEQARKFCDMLFSEYPTRLKSSFRSRFRSIDDAQHIGAWWELYVFGLYQKLGYTVSVLHREIPSVRTPDFLVASPTGEMYVECTAAFINEGSVTNSPRIEAWIYDCVNKIENKNFTLLPTIVQQGTQQPSAGEIVKPLDQWLSSLDPDVILDDIRNSPRTSDKLGSLPQTTITARDWTLTFSACPRLPAGRHKGHRALGALPPTAAFFDRSIERLRDTVKDKGSRYRLDKPLVVAVLAATGFAEEDEMTDAMFGNKEVRFEIGNPRSVRTIRKRNGYWRGAGANRGARVSAVLFGYNIHPWSALSTLPSLWVNPWAARPIVDHSNLATFTADDNGRVYDSTSSVSAMDIFRS